MHDEDDSLSPLTPFFSHSRYVAQVRHDLAIFGEEQGKVLKKSLARFIRWSCPIGIVYIALLIHWVSSNLLRHVRARPSPGGLDIKPARR